VGTETQRTPTSVAAGDEDELIASLLKRAAILPALNATEPYDLALFTTDVTSPIAAVVERYATRWSIEPANAAGKQQLGVGQARNRLPQAVHRTVPFGMLVQSLVIIWYAVAGHHPDDMTRRRQAEPWYDLTRK
jgi:hypothetical protein